MVRVGPDTVGKVGEIAAYQYGASQIQGFTHTQLEGPGGSGNGYSQILLMPTRGALNLDPNGWPSAFSHDEEEAAPGYYRVRLADYRVVAEMTASGHAALHRYTFEPSADDTGEAGARHLILDLGHSQGASRGGEVRFVNARTIEGFGAYNVHPALGFVLQNVAPTGDMTVYFHLELDATPSDHGVFRVGQGTTGAGVSEGTGSKLGAWVTFPADAPGARPAAPWTLGVRVGVSLISVEQAAANLHAELGTGADALPFDEARARADARWNEVLNRVQAQGDEATLTTFYTALYHALMQPADYTEAGGRYVVATDGSVKVFDDGRPSEAPNGRVDGPGAHRFYTDDWCMWDTYRTSHPLQVLLEPERRGDVAWSLLRAYEEGGWLPKCTWAATGYSRVMIGTHAIPILADAWVKGVRDFDGALAWEAVDKALWQDLGADENPALQGACGYGNLGTIPDYITLGYVPTECDPTQSASMTLEYAYDDWAAARFAEALGRADDAAILDERAQSYRNHWDAAEGFMVGRHADGSWVSPFDPADTSDSNDFCEASSWIYSFFVPHDVPGLVALMGGPEAFVTKLDGFFAGGHFDPANEPSFHIPWLYARVGALDKTAERVRAVLVDEFDTSPRGLPGNDDSGATSAWYVLGALGLFPMAPGDGVYDLTAPLLPRAVIHLHPGYYPGGTVTIRAEVVDGPPGVGGQSLPPEAMYIRAVTWNGEAVPLQPHGPQLTHAQLVAGGELRFELATTPP